MFFRYQDFAGCVGNPIVPSAQGIRKMLERRKNSRSIIDPAKARKEFWAMKQAEHEREIKIFGHQKIG